MKALILVRMMIVLDFRMSRRIVKKSARTCSVGLTLSTVGN